ACIVYTPQTGFSGVDEIQYFVQDQEMDSSNISTITITVEEEVIMDSTITIEGKLMTSSGAPIEGIIVIKDGNNILETQNGSDYTFSFNSANIEAARNYIIEVSKTDGVLEGVSARDMVEIQKHLLGITPFSNNFQAIAADVNDTGTVSAADMVVIQKTLLGINTTFPIDSWTFFVEEDIQNGQDVRSLPVGFILDQTRSGNFIGVKAGDVNGN
ncbi:MAG: dockerin type I domain-containing protein, partial [Bacteroidota bacterium]